jgi:hypothetical protein
MPPGRHLPGFQVGALMRWLAVPSMPLRRPIVSLPAHRPSQQQPTVSNTRARAVDVLTTAPSSVTATDLPQRGTKTRARTPPGRPTRMAMQLPGAVYVKLIATGPRTLGSVALPSRTRPG